jgi:hypothetical protein
MGWGSSIGDMIGGAVSGMFNPSNGAQVPTVSDQLMDNINAFENNKTKISEANLSALENQLKYSQEAIFGIGSTDTSSKISDKVRLAFGDELEKTQDIYEKGKDSKYWDDFKDSDTYNKILSLIDEGIKYSGSAWSAIYSSAKTALENGDPLPDKFGAKIFREQYFKAIRESEDFGDLFDDTFDEAAVSEAKKKYGDNLTNDQVNDAIAAARSMFGSGFQSLSNEQAEYFLNTRADPTSGEWGNNADKIFNSWITEGQLVAPDATNGKPMGLLDQQAALQEAADNQNAASNTRLREAELADVKKLSPQVAEALKAANPELYATLDKIGGFAEEDPELLSTDTALENPEINVAQNAGSQGYKAAMAQNAQNIRPTQPVQSQGYNVATVGNTERVQAAPGVQSQGFNAATVGNTERVQAAPGVQSQGYNVSTIGNTERVQAAPGVQSQGYNVSTVGNAAQAAAAPDVNAAWVDPSVNIKAAQTGSALGGSLQDQAKAALLLGGDLSAREIRDAQQASRSAYADRGIVRSDAAVFDELKSNEASRRARENERRDFAMGVDSLYQGERMANADRSLQASTQNQNAMNAAKRDWTAQQLQAQQGNQSTRTQVNTQNADRQTQVMLSDAGARNQAGSQQSQQQLQAGMTNQSQANQIALDNAARQLQARTIDAAARNQAGSQQSQQQLQAGMTNQSQANQISLDNAARQQAARTTDASAWNQVRSQQSQQQLQAGLANQSQANQIALDNAARQLQARTTDAGARNQAGSQQSQQQLQAGMTNQSQANQIALDNAARQQQISLANASAVNQSLSQQSQLQLQADLSNQSALNAAYSQGATQAYNTGVYNAEDQKQRELFNISQGSQEYQRALQLLGAYQGLYVDPYQGVLGRSSINPMTNVAYNNLARSNNLGIPEVWNMGNALTQASIQAQSNQYSAEQNKDGAIAGGFMNMIGSYMGAG